MARPRIGITCSPADGVVTRIEKVGRGYVDGIDRAGGLPVVLPALDPDLVAEVLAGLDGLLLTGGGDVDPARFGAEPEPETGEADARRDAWELALVGAARAAGLPILGICRGAQVLNVAYGGTLVQHLPHRTSAEHDDVPRAGLEVHDVAVTAGSRLEAVVGPGVLRANTLHHQAIDVPGTGLVVSGRADDRVIEAVEAPDERVLAVQWHPELLLDRPAHQALFGWIVAESAAT